MSEKLTVCFIPKIKKEGHAVNQISTITPKIKMDVMVDIFL